MGARSVSGSLTNFWKPSPHVVVPHHPEYRRRDLVLWQLDIPSFVEAQERISPFCAIMEKTQIGGAAEGREGESWRTGYREGCNWVVKLVN